VKIEVERKSLFSWDCTLRMDGRVRGTMGFNWFRRGGTIEIGSATYDIRYQGFLSRVWELQQGAKVLATATKKGFRTRFRLECDAGTFDIERGGLFSRTYDVNQGGREVGSIGATGVFSRGLVGHLPDSWAGSDAAFVAWLVTMVRRRRARANNSS